MQVPLQAFLPLMLNQQVTNLKNPFHLETVMTADWTHKYVRTRLCPYWNIWINSAYSRTTAKSILIAPECHSYKVNPKIIFQKYNRTVPQFHSKCAANTCFSTHAVCRIRNTSGPYKFVHRSIYAVIWMTDTNTFATMNKAVIRIPEGDWVANRLS